MSGKLRILLLSLLLLLCTSCTPFVPPATPTPSVTPTPPPTPTSTLTPLPSLTPTPDAALLASGWVALEQGNLDEAARIAEQVLAQDENAAEAYALAGSVHGLRYEDLEGIADLEQAWKLGYETAEMLDRLAEMYIRARAGDANSEQYQQDLQRAMEIYQRVLELDPDDPTAKDMAEVLSSRVDWGTDISASDPAAVEHFHQAESAYRQGQYDQAIAEYQAAIAIDPDFSQAYLYLGDTYYIQDQFMTATLYFEQAVTINPGLIQGWAFLGDAYDKLGLYEHSEAAYQRALAIYPSYQLALDGIQDVTEVMAHRVDTDFCPYSLLFAHWDNMELKNSPPFDPPSTQQGSFRIGEDRYLMNLSWQPMTETADVQELGAMAVDFLQDWGDVDLVGEPQSFRYGAVPMAYQAYNYTPPGHSSPQFVGAQATWMCGQTLLILQIEVSSGDPAVLPAFLFPHLEAFRCKCAGR